jgi:hypothetical protein
MIGLKYPTRPTLLDSISMIPNATIDLPLSGSMLAM